MHNRNLMSHNIALEIIESGVKIPSLPASAQQLLSIAQKPVSKIDIKILDGLIQKDPVLFAQILKLANSPYYTTGRDIVSLRDAIMRIGLSDTISSLYIYLFKNTLPPFPQIKELSDKDYWEEAWACAIVNRRLGDSRLLVESLPGDLYIAGLLHGIGKLILAVYDPKRFYQCIKLTRSSGEPLESAELKIFGTTDALVAEKILESWHLPPNVCAAVGYYQHPESAEPEYREIAALTQFAAALVKIAKDADNPENNTDKIQNGQPSQFSSLDLLDNTYISKNGLSLLAEKEQQQKIVSEIISILKMKSSETQTRETGKAIPQKSLKESASDSVKPPSSYTSGSASPPEKRGLFSWLRTFFGR